MTAEEAIKIIECAIAEVEWDYPLEYAIAFEKAIEALKYQIPQKPKADDFPYCPKCKKTLSVGETECSCGQRIDWRVENDD